MELALMSLLPSAQERLEGSYEWRHRYRENGRGRKTHLFLFQSLLVLLCHYFAHVLSLFLCAATQVVGKCYRVFHAELKQPRLAQLYINQVRNATIG